MRYPLLKDPSRDLRLVLLRSVQFVEKSGCFFNGKPIEIICEIHSFSHEEKPEYFALSYPWKGRYLYNQISRYILVNGLVAKIGENLALALWTLRGESADIYIWADALCINQKDESEMDLHIKRMHEIYSQATETKVWLGVMYFTLDIDKNDKVVKLIREFGTQAIETGCYDALLAMRTAAKRGADSEARMWQDRANALVDQVLDSNEWSYDFPYKFLDFCDIYYWSRVWILQEISLSSRLDFLYGLSRRTLSPEHIQAAVVLFEVAQSRAASGQNTGRMDFSDRGLRGFRLSKFGIPLPIDRSPINTVLGLRSRYQDTPRGGLSLMELLSIIYVDYSVTSPIEFTEPKDSIFALLSLAKDASQFRDVLQYTMSLNEIFRETARVIIRNGQIDLLSYCWTPSERRRERETPDRLGPSWVPDWASYVRRPVCGLPPKTAFASSGSGSFPSMPVPDNRTPQHLALQGMLVDKIETVGEPLHWDHYANTYWDYINARRLLHYLAEILQFSRQSNEKNSESDHDIYMTQSDRSSVPYLTPVADRLISEQGDRLGRDKARECLEKGFVEILSYLEEHVRSEGKLREGQVLSEELITYFQSMVDANETSPLLSVQGYVGISEGCEPGDQIYLFAGAKFPYILREVKDVQGAEDKKVFQLVGPAYVHGIMYGEFLLGDRARAWKEVTLA
ncbi:hypothetical protein CNMCM8694_001649 [Aspergillus lentulus]|nr:hypothetical protein CNMCM8060_007365 [Aspergillus lentulus]KAF4189887.1 hypothetical protein CNMCM7927_006671 [Aspergillus lentulus]KAF4191620.1 hypothetical protein CNMCM8694_001649 [Aspergillus lentulus]GFF74875.1 hypothetical protein IFM62136_08933 [Aspergillus lentulus]